MCMECRIACQKPSPGHDSEANLRRKGKFICFPRCVLWELDFTAFPGKESADSTLEMKDKTEDENGETDIEKKKRNLKLVKGQKRPQEQGNQGSKREQGQHGLEQA
ncbi:hypothetical protein V6N13_065709 [Hibiscus sabdariffa]